MSKQRGLGRGLGAFFPTSRAGAREEGDRVASIPIGSIAPNPVQPRRAFDERELESLAQSIRANGVLSPILVRPSPGGGDGFELLAGERRLRAARIAGLTTMPALIRAADDTEALEIALLENLQRADLNPIEEAAGYRRLIDEHGFTQDSLSHRLGKARSTLANALRLLALPSSVQTLVRDGALSGGHARALAALPSAKAETIARAAVSRGLSVRDLERLAGAASPAPKKRRPRPAAGRAQRALSAELADIETRLRFALATRVAVHPSGAGGTIEIRYAGDEELQRIVDAICPEDE